MDALRQGREQASFRITEREQALRWVGFVLDEPHGLRLLRAVLAASPHFEPDRLTDVEVIEEVLTALERRRLRVFQGADFRGGGTAPGPEPQRPTVPPDPPGHRPERSLSFYEICVVDERDSPIEGLPLRLATPAGVTTRRTDAAGRVRVAEAPPGFGAASCAEPESFAELTRGWQSRPRRRWPLPVGPDWHVRTPRSLREPVVLPDAVPQRLMIVTRTDVTHQSASWTHTAAALRLADPAAPAALEQGAMVRLSLHADASAAHAVVLATSRAVASIEPQPVPASAFGGTGSASAVSMVAPWPARSDSDGTPWLDAPIDAMHEALFAGRFEEVWPLLWRIPAEPHRSPPRVWAPPSAELALLAILCAAVRMDGWEDPPCGDPTSDEG
ncbi:MAG: hypothetical protein IT373_15065 [Polyangiaceae bacterium]|nr:hypothetical protein [Polyangiaceae bacterium]